MEQGSVDYAHSGMCVREAIMEAVGRGQTTGKRPQIVWDGHSVTTGDIWNVPPSGLLTITIDDARSDLRQGLEIQVPQGGVYFADGTLTDRMHMWQDDDLSETMTYPYTAPAQKLFTCNIYEQTYGGKHAPRLERWGDWAGMWIEEPSPRGPTTATTARPIHPPSRT